MIELYQFTYLLYPLYTQYRNLKWIWKFEKNTYQNIDLFPEEINKKIRMNSI